MRQAVGLVVGVVVAILTVMLVEWLGHRLAPPPPGFVDLPPAEMGAAIPALPLGTKIAVLVAWFAGALGGGALAVGIARRAWPGWVVAALILAGTVFAIATIPHPLWMMIVGVVAPIVAGWIATRLAPRAEAGPETAAV